MRDLRQEYFDYQAREWDNASYRQKQEIVQRILNEFAPIIETPVLDVGSGTGILLPILIERLNLNPKIFEFDIAFRMLAQARMKNIKTGVIHHINGDVHLLPFADQSFATAICFESLPHFRDKQSALQELHRVLKAGGDLLVLHLMCHVKINDLHYQAGGVVYQDYLPSLTQMAELLSHHQFELLQSVERENLYLIKARKSHS